MIQKPIKYGKHIIKFPIKYKYKSKKKDLIIQSPKMYLPFQLMNLTNYLAKVASGDFSCKFTDHVSFCDEKLKR